MAQKLFTVMDFGLEGRLVEVEADIHQGLPAFAIVGLGDASVQEAKERIKSAIRNSGFKYPPTKKVVNLAPADLRKHGPHFDLPMAIGILAASGQIKMEGLAETLVMGELALDGSVRPVNGMVTMVLFAKKNGWKRCVIPRENMAEAGLIKGIEYIPVRSLGEAVEYLNAGGKREEPGEEGEPTRPNTTVTTPTAAAAVDTSTRHVDFTDIIGQQTAKRALTVAAAGGHHILMSGPPGVGKTMLSKAFAGILPEPDDEERMEILQILSCAGLIHQQHKKIQELSTISRPFRELSPTATLLSLSGGGVMLTPGEVTLAHRGVLFMDELPEFPRAHLESLRQPLEEKVVHLSRVQSHITYPANFLLIAGMNPCPCGYAGDPVHECTCRPYQIIQYQKKLSGPLLDRIDLFLELQREQISGAQQTNIQPTSDEYRRQVEAARRIQQDRFQNHHNKNPSLKTNSDITAKEIKLFCHPTSDANDFAKEVSEKLQLSGRGYHRLLKVARTIADLAQHETIELEDIAEAAQYRHRVTTAAGSPS